MQPDFIKFSSQANPKTLKAIREIADLEGKKLQFILDEALREYLERRKTKPKKNIVSTFEDSLKEFNSLYESLAK